MAQIIATGPRYDNKVDMYSLGIILYEMCYSFDTGMERIETLENLRKPEIVMPLIRSLIIPPLNGVIIGLRFLLQYYFLRDFA